MGKWKVFVSRKIPESGIKLLKIKCNVEVSKKNVVLSKKELMKKIKNKDALLCLLTDKIDEDVIKAGNKLKIIANYAVGFDNIDIKAASRYNIPVTNTPGVLTESVAEHSVALMMAISRRIVEADKWTRAGKYKGWEPMLLLGQDLYEKTLGIIGLGRIGTAVARQCARGFNMKILYNDVRKNEDFEKEYNARYVDLKTLLKESDYISLHVPGGAETTHLIGKKELSLMKKTAYLINTARGPIIHHDALLKALEKKKIAGAALDVFECEPKLVCYPNEYKILAHLDNIIITPHIASATITTREAMSELAAKNILALMNGETPSNLVNTDVKLNLTKN